MKMLRSNLVAILLMTLSLSSLLDAQTSKIGVSEQSNFTAEDGVQTPIAMPLSVLQLLQRDEFVMETLADDHLTAEELPASWMVCSAVHLANLDETDYVVVGREDLGGAHATHFWIIRSNSAGIYVVLRAFADQVNILQSRWNSVRMIRTANYTAVSLQSSFYRFDGTRYILFRTEKNAL